MSSKAEERKAFKTLMKEFPVGVVQLIYSINTFGTKPEETYNAYSNTLGGLSTVAVTCHTPMEAVNRLIKMRKEKEAQNATDYQQSKASD
jgi:hypothetical protein